MNEPTTSIEIGEPGQILVCKDGEFIWITPSELIIIED